MMETCSMSGLVINCTFIHYTIYYMRERERERERSFELREATKHQSNNSEHATCNIWTKYNKKSLHFEV
jgi:hypothetical protein